MEFAKMSRRARSMKIGQRTPPPWIDDDVNDVVNDESVGPPKRSRTEAPKDSSREGSTLSSLASASVTKLAALKPPPAAWYANNTEEEEGGAASVGERCDDADSSSALLPPPVAFAQAVTDPKRNATVRQAGQALGTCRRIVVIDFETTGFSSTVDDIIEVGATEMIDLEPTGLRFHARCRPREGKSSHPAALAVHGLSEEVLKGLPVFASAAVAGNLVRFLSIPPPETQDCPSDANEERRRDGELERHANPYTPRQTLLATHNAAFDMRMLRAGMDRWLSACGDGYAKSVMTTLEERTTWHAPLCSMALFRAMYPNQLADLDSCARFFGLSARDTESQATDGISLSPRQSSPDTAGASQPGKSHHFHSAGEDADLAAQVTIRLAAILSDA